MNAWAATTTSPIKTSRRTSNTFTPVDGGHLVIRYYRRVDFDHAVRAATANHAGVWQFVTRDGQDAYVLPMPEGASYLVGFSH